MPRLSNLYLSSIRAFQLQDILLQISGLGYQANQQGKIYRLGVLESGQEPLAPPITLPDGWSISTNTPIDYSDNGICTGGIVTLQKELFSQQWLLEAPLCQPKPYEVS